ncbi:MAG: hypothetical protein FWG13_01635, partial [Leptospirales bacterium]|nr:hypothetical protein [Leptospirales bacterium]
MGNIRPVVDFIKNIFAWAFSLIGRIAGFLAGSFLEIGFFSKLLCLTVIPAIFAAIKPSARYYIFESWFYINNPISESLVGIVLLVIIGFFIRPLFAFILRAVPSAGYFVWIIYLQVTHSISKAPYELTFWHYLNVAVPLLII